jgi:hypothetical protein
MIKKYSYTYTFMPVIYKSVIKTKIRSTPTAKMQRIREITFPESLFIFMMRSDDQNNKIDNNSTIDKMIR